MITDEDRRWMRRCLTLARRAEGRTSPNPIVGCVVVSREGKVLAEGFHRRAGTAHAERAALEQLGGRAEGATLYVNLEPCAHEGKNRLTKPCVPLLASSGIRRLVFGMHDPFPGHGGGLEVLRRAGIEVVGPVEESQCQRANDAFTVYAREGRAHFTLKAAMSLDGRIATSTGQSRWITGEQSRRDVHLRRARADAVLVGAGTVLADDPLLTVRGVRGGRDPVRVILDGRLHISPEMRMLQSSSAALTLVATTEEAPESHVHALESAGAQVLRLPGHGGRVDLHALARALAERRLLRVLVEGGAQTHAAFLHAGLCDRLLLYMAPLAVGGRGALAWLGGSDLSHLADAQRFRFDAPPRALGEDLLVELVPRCGPERDTFFVDAPAIRSLPHGRAGTSASEPGPASIRSFHGAA